MFAVVRHPDIESLGILPHGTLDLQRAKGWIRVSPWAAAPADLYLPDYAESYVDLDAEPESPKKPQRPVKPVADEEKSA